MTVSHYVEYGALRGMVAALDLAGLPRATRFAEWLGKLGYEPLGIRRELVEKQIADSFPGMPHERIVAIARASYAHLARTTIETTLLPLMSRERILDLMEGCDGWEHVESALALGRGLLIVTGHLGNWELAGAYTSARVGSLDVIARHMANPLVDRYLTRIRERIGMGVIFDDQAVRRVPRALRDGKAVAVVTDQATVGLASAWVPFLGRMAKTPRGPAVFALRYGAPIVFGTAIRGAGGRFRMIYEPVPIEPSAGGEAAVDDIVRAYTAVLERWVRHVPEQYFWQHRRWKHLDDAPANLEPVTATHG